MLGKYSASAEHFDKSHEMRSLKLGDKHVITAQSLLKIAHLYIDMYEDQKA